MERDHVAVRRGDRREPLADHAVQRRQLRPVRVRAGAEVRRVSGVGRRERRLDPVHVADAVGDVHPDVRVDRPGSALALEVRHALEVLAQRDDRRGRPRVLDQGRQPVVEAEAVADDEVGMGDPLHVGRGGIERVDLAAPGHEAVDVDPGAPDPGDHVREHRRGGDDRDRVGVRGGRRRRGAGAGAAARRHERDRQERQDGAGAQPATAPHAGGDPPGGWTAADARHAAQTPNSSSRWDVTLNDSRSPTSAITAPSPRSSMSWERPQRVQIAWW